MDSSLPRPVLFALPAVLLAAGAALGWAVLGQDHDALAAMVQGWLSRAQGTPWALPAVCGLYLALGAVLFPVTVLNLAMAMVFGALWGVVYGLIGSMLSAAVYFGLGRMIRRGRFACLLDHPNVRRVDQGLRDAGVAGVALLRMVPIGPFTLFNLASGLSSIRFADYMWGTFLALLPGAVARGIIGDSLMDLVLSPDAQDLCWLGGGVALWAAIMGGTHMVLKKYRQA